MKSHAFLAPFRRRDDSAALAQAHDGALAFVEDVAQTKVRLESALADNAALERELENLHHVASDHIEAATQGRRLAEEREAQTLDDLRVAQREISVLLTHFDVIRDQTQRAAGEVTAIRIKYKPVAEVPHATAALVDEGMHTLVQQVAKKE